MRADRGRRSGRARGQRGPCRLDQVTTGGEAVLRVLLERSGDDVGDCLRQVGPDGADVRHRSREDGGDERTEVVLRERPAAGEQLEEHDPEGVDVGPAVHGLAGDLLGRGVGDRGRDLAVAGQRRQRGHVLRDAEVGQHRLLAAVVAGLEQDVRRFDVPVEQPAGMCVVQCAADRGDDLQGVLRRERPALPQGDVQIRAVDEAHGDPQQVAVLTLVQDVDDVRVLERAEQVGLALESLPELRDRREARVQHLQRHVAGQRAVPGEVDRAHAAGTQLALEEVPAHGGADRDLHATPARCQPATVAAASVSLLRRRKRWPDLPVSRWGRRPRRGGGGAAGRCHRE